MQPLLDAIRPTTFVMPVKLQDRLGLDITLATETFQHTGSFKFRAAYNVVLNNANEEFIGVSSGNFGQALAYACKLLGRKCTVVMPHNSVQVKVDAVRGFGAEPDLIDVNLISRAERTRQLLEERPGAYHASAYDDQFVIDGNSTLGDELAPHQFDVVIVPVGGGGLLSGIADSFRRNECSTEIFGAEPIMANDAARSLREGRIIANEKEPQTIADGTRTLSVGKLNFPIIQKCAAGIIEVTEENIAEGLRILFSHANLKCEPTSALALGAILENPRKFKGHKICLVITGGNVDPETYRSILK